MRRTAAPNQRGAALLAVITVVAVQAWVGAAPQVAAAPLVACPNSSLPEGGRPTWYGSMPQPANVEIETTTHLVDGAGGVQLEVRVIRPLTADRVPAVLNSGPYAATRNALRDSGVAQHCDELFFVQRGYAFVVASVRGSGDSTGCLDYGGLLDQQDGAAVVNWITAQEWSNASVGMIGLSYEAVAQFSAAATAPPGLKAIIPASPSPLYDQSHPGAALTEPVFRNQVPGPATALGAAPSRQATGQGPLDAVASSLCAPTFYQRVNSVDGTRDEFWQERYIPNLVPGMRAAVLTSTGLPFDVALGFHEMWSALEHADLPRAAITGPWIHENPRIAFDASGRMRAVRASEPLSMFPWLYVELRWFEHWLKGNDTGVLNEPRVTSFDQFGNLDHRDSLRGGDIWVLRPTGERLATKAAPGATTYRDVLPNVPRVVVWRTPLIRAKYQTDPVAAPVRLAGQPVLTLHAAIDTTDTNFAVVLHDVAPDGNYRVISHGALDARHRHDLEAPGVDVRPGVTESYRIPLSYIDHTVEFGHRLALTVAGADIVTAFLDGLYGIESDADHRATVTVVEGPGRTVLRLPIRE